MNLLPRFYRVSVYLAPSIARLIFAARFRDRGIMKYDTGNNGSGKRTEHARQQRALGGGIVAESYTGLHPAAFYFYYGAYAEIPVDHTLPRAQRRGGVSHSGAAV